MALLIVRIVRIFMERDLMKHSKLTNMGKEGYVKIDARMKV